eukprot:CAMPEP_0206848618 /NCGR_PEP_ID=MMETSP0975-20121206/26105_1 /ASSEMBLY_ACC=CAM_ASM_000399 /TAXON_ID=483370 /ORGANISM="non described non described, Strain CCMP2097" /LENGTH=155 /DNA_ID=CAMNT_0054391255 /DNA_START=403 /DNA_END=868 /DNA_ORIENTATION=-
MSARRSAARSAATHPLRKLMLFTRRPLAELHEHLLRRLFRLALLKGLAAVCLRRRLLCGARRVHAALVVQVALLEQHAARVDARAVRDTALVNACFFGFPPSIVTPPPIMEQYVPVTFQGRFGTGTLPSSLQVKELHGFGFFSSAAAQASSQNTQ